MGPFVRRPPQTTLAGVASATLVDVRVRVVSPNAVTSPFTGLRAALFQIDLVERRTSADDEAERRTFDVYDALGSTIVGDTLVVEADGALATVVARRAKLVFRTMNEGGAPIATVPPEIAPLLARASGRGVLCYREHPIASGDELRLRAVVEPTKTVVDAAYRSGPGTRLVVREDLGPITIEELFAPPPF
jgi:hypothetical protein